MQAPVTSPPTTATLEEAVELAFQIDCYGPQSHGWATMLSTLLRDEYGVNALSPSGITPLYADDARMMPTVFAEEQYEPRWSLDARFQMNPVTTIPATASAQPQPSATPISPSIAPAEDNASSHECLASATMVADRIRRPTTNL